MASGRASNSGSKSFDFGSDDILCSYEDFANQEGDNGNHTDPSVTANSAKEFNKSRMARSSGFPNATYSPPEESSFNHDVTSTIEKTMKKHTDNIMRFLEGISSRLSQLELYCYNIDKSIGEMRSDLIRDNVESESKLKSLEKHVQEVHRSVQILRDKQELADTQKELAKLQLVQKDSSSAGNTQQKEERTSPPASEAKKSENSPDVHGQQLALALPHQVAPQPSLPARPVDHQQPPMGHQSPMPPQSMAQVQGYYLPAPQMTNLPGPPQPSETQYLQPQSQIPNHSSITPQPTQSQVNQSPHVQSSSPYQQQWTQQQVPPPQQPVMQPQIRPSSQAVYSTYVPSQSNQSPAEMAPNSMPMQLSFVSQPGSAGPEAMQYGYNSAGRQTQQQPPMQHLKPSYGAQPGHGNAYMMYDGESGRMHHPPPQSHFQPSAYPPTSVGSQNPPRMPSPNMLVPQSRSHPYNELIEKLVNMGYRGDHVVAVIQRLEESGQPIDFNAVLDRLNGHTSGGPQRGWSG